MTWHLLLVAQTPPPAIDPAIALCRHVYARYCHTSRYTLSARWLDQDGTIAREMRLGHRTDLEPLAEVFGRAVDDGAGAVVLTRCNAVARLQWLARLRRRWGILGHMEQIEVLWQRGGLRLGDTHLESWLAFDLLYRKDQPPAPILASGFRLEQEVPELAADLEAAVGCPFSGALALTGADRKTGRFDFRPFAGI